MHLNVGQNFVLKDLDPTHVLVDAASIDKIKQMVRELTCGFICPKTSTVFDDVLKKRYVRRSTLISRAMCG